MTDDIRTRPAAPPGGKARTSGQDFARLWFGQSASLVGDQFMVVALPLLSVTVLHTSLARAALLPFALYAPFLLVGLPAGAVVDRMRRRSVMLLCDSVQAATFLAVFVCAKAHVLSFWGLAGLVFVAGTMTVFFQVACTSYPPALFTDEAELHRRNSQLYLSDSVSKAAGPVVAGPVIAFLSVAGAVAANAASFLVSVLAVLSIRHREPAPEPARRSRGWLRRDIWEGLRFVFRHPVLEPVLTCGMTYTVFLTMVESILVLYCHSVLGLGPVGTGIVVGASAAGFPVGNALSVRLAAWQGVPRTCVIGTVVSVTGLICMPVAGHLHSTVGLVAGCVVHCVGEGAFGPLSLTLRQTETPPALLGRVNAVQRFLVWGMIPLGSLLASLAISLWSLQAAMAIGAVGTVLCVPVLVRRGIRGGIAVRGELSPLPQG
ncbi:MFS transporter [Streptomyces sp. CA2R106]|uniref:MFS transporter n=1 Tax=Streptomyces sp. CA2R106 TaxID=3120153 RepID=UPI00300BE1E4